MPSNNSVVIASAGSGKTWDICNKAINNPPPFKKALLVTYTNRGKESIINEYKKQNLGVVDDWIVVKTWYQFILSEFIKPYQVDFFKKINLIKSIDFSRAYGYTNMISSTKPERYLNNNYDVLSNEVSRLAVLMIEKSSNKVLQRLEETYCTIYFDEVQDFIGDDISILELLFDSSISIHCVGDPKQSTYKTHNTKKYSKKSGVNTYDYFSSLEEKGVITLLKKNTSRRCNEKICSLANQIDSNDPLIQSENEEITCHDGVFIISSEDINEYYEYFKPQVLRYDIKTVTSLPNCLNYGVSKGMTFKRTLIYPNGPLKKFLIKNIKIKSTPKYFVAVTRAKYSVCFVIDNMKENDKFKRSNISINDKKVINCFEFSS